MHMKQDFEFPDDSKLERTALTIVLPASDNAREIVPTFSPSPEPLDDHRFTADSQLAVLLMGVAAAITCVAALAGAEHLLSMAIDLGWLAPPPGPETYGLPI